MRPALQPIFPWSLDVFRAFLSSYHLLSIDTSGWWNCGWRWRITFERTYTEIIGHYRHVYLYIICLQQDDSLCSFNIRGDVNLGSHLWTWGWLRKGRQERGHYRCYKIPISSIRVIFIINKCIHLQRSTRNRIRWPKDGRNKKRKKMSSKSSNMKDFDISVLAHIHQYYQYDIQDYETMNWLGIFRVALLLTDWNRRN